MKHLMQHGMSSTNQLLRLLFLTFVILSNSTRLELSFAKIHEPLGSSLEFNDIRHIKSASKNIQSKRNDSANGESKTSRASATTSNPTPTTQVQRLGSPPLSPSTSLSLPRGSRRCRSGRTSASVATFTPTIPATPRSGAIRQASMMRIVSQMVLRLHDGITQQIAVFDKMMNTFCTVNDKKGHREALAQALDALSTTYLAFEPPSVTSSTMKHTLMSSNIIMPSVDIASIYEVAWHESLLTLYRELVHLYHFMFAVELSTTTIVPIAGSGSSGQLPLLPSPSRSNRSPFLSPRHASASSIGTNITIEPPTPLQSQLVATIDLVRTLLQKDRDDDQLCIESGVWCAIKEMRLRTSLSHFTAKIVEVTTRIFSFVTPILIPLIP
jgi:hypothetical protein